MYDVIDEISAAERNENGGTYHFAESSNGVRKPRRLLGERRHLCIRCANFSTAPRTMHDKVPGDIDIIND